MKITKTEIRESLERIQKLMRSLAKTAKELATAQRDAAQLEAKIAELGEPDYNDDAKIEQLERAQKKLELCHKMIKRLTEKGDERVAADGDAPRVLMDGSMLVVKILNEIVDRRVETVACSLRIFSKDKASATNLAMQSDIVKSARSTVAYFGWIYSYVATCRVLPQIMTAAERVEAVLTEALKDAPDLMQFLEFQPGTDEQAAPGEQPTK